MRSLVLGESNEVVVSLKPSVQRLVKNQFRIATTLHNFQLCYLIKVLHHDGNLLDGQGVDSLVHLVYEALNISAEVGDANRLDPGFQELRKLRRDGLRLRWK